MKGNLSLNYYKRGPGEVSLATLVIDDRHIVAPRFPGLATAPDGPGAGLRTVGIDRPMDGPMNLKLDNHVDSARVRMPPRILTRHACMHVIPGGDENDYTIPARTWSGARARRLLMPLATTSRSLVRLLLATRLRAAPQIIISALPWPQPYDILLVPCM